VCGTGQKDAEAWSDGSPNHIDDNGRKQYAHHPDHERLDRCSGNDTLYLCLKCGDEFVVDSRAPVDHRPACGAADIVDVRGPDGRQCPSCKAGVVTVDSTSFLIS
jgi:DNA-directed RNA polymerase subunit RPC12/RpoP